MAHYEVGENERSKLARTTELLNKVTEQRVTSRTLRTRLEIEDALYPTYLLTAGPGSHAQLLLGGRCGLMPA
ncbi:MAG: hypothetical protein JSV16_04020 [Candidatus Hydrogenedentota bacterium]|nr:MAG: hypothetical protein JSV16_04020 [Candidatus Hydrogenedentota bacterium]